MVDDNITIKVSSHIREHGYRNPGNFYFRRGKLFLVESGIGIPLLLRLIIIIIIIIIIKNLYSAISVSSMALYNNRNSKKIKKNI